MTCAITYFEMRIKYTLTMHLDTCIYRRSHSRIKIRVNEKEKKWQKRRGKTTMRNIYDYCETVYHW